MTASVIRIGNSKGLILPANLLKSLSISERDELSISEHDGGILIKKIVPSEKKTPFSALDEWNEMNGFLENDSLEDALEYAAELKKTRHNKPAAEW